MSDTRDIVERLRLRCALELDEQYLCDAIECEAADEIERLRAEIARLREERRWISVGERLPDGQSDDVVTARGPWEDGGYSIGIGWWNGEFWMSYNSDRDMPAVAFWQPLPPGPEGHG